MSFITDFETKLAAAADAIPTELEDLLTHLAAGVHKLAPFAEIIEGATGNTAALAVTEVVDKTAVAIDAGGATGA
jgi:hypothetical protein